MENPKPLTDEELDKAAGGYIHRNGDQWEVINDNTGTVMFRVSTIEMARNIARKEKQSTREI